MSVNDTSAAPVLGVSLSDELIVELITRRNPYLLHPLRCLLDLTEASVLYLGGDRFRPAQGYGAAEAAPGNRLDPLFAAQWLLTKLPQAAALVSSATEVEHPFNYARRILALDHFTGGRLGVVLGAQDSRSGWLHDGRSAWTTTPVGPELSADFADTLRELWNSWPRESIIADKERGVFADSAQIVKINHHGHYRVRGPLNAPSSIQDEPVLAWHLSTGAAELAYTGAAELLLAEVPGAASELSQQRPSVINADIETFEDLPQGSSGVLLRLSNAAAITAAVSVLASRTQPPPGAVVEPVRSTATLGTLRQRLGLTARSLDLSGFEPAFAGKQSVKGVL